MTLHNNTKEEQWRCYQCGTIHLWEVDPCTKCGRQRKWRISIESSPKDLKQQRLEELKMLPENKALLLAIPPDIHEHFNNALNRFLIETIDLMNQRSSEMLINQNKEMNDQCAKKVQETVSWCKEMMEECIGETEPYLYEGIEPKSEAYYDGLHRVQGRNSLRAEQRLRARTLLDHPNNGDIKSNVTTNDDK